jgi:hypothetical protein
MVFPAQRVSLGQSEPNISLSGQNTLGFLPFETEISQEVGQ